MRVLSSAVSLNVEDVLASSTFLVEHFAFREQMAADGFASLSRADSGMNVVFLRRRLPTLPADQRDDHSSGGSAPHAGRAGVARPLCTITSNNSAADPSLRAESGRGRAAPFASDDIHADCARMRERGAVFRSGNERAGGHLAATRGAFVPSSLHARQAIRIDSVPGSGRPARPARRRRPRG